jgi:hypothetical protein
MKNRMPKLKILPVEKLLRHEWHDDQRSKPLVERLRASGVLRNPPIVTPFGDDSGRYMVLDGANRTTALGQMGYPHCICQVVDADDEGLSLNTWNHVLWNWETEEFLKALGKLKAMKLEEIDSKVKRPQKKWPIKTLVWLQVPKGKAFIARSQPGDLNSRAQKLVEIAETYTGNADLDRTRAQQISELEGIYKDLCAIVVYPAFKVSEVLKLCGDGVMLPPGVTRFSISPRALRVNYPLDELASNQSLDEKNSSLDRWLNERIARKGIRHYAEASVLFDE